MIGRSPISRTPISRYKRFGAAAVVAAITFIRQKLVAKLRSISVWG